MKSGWFGFAVALALLTLIGFSGVGVQPGVKVSARSSPSEPIDLRSEVQRLKDELAQIKDRIEGGGAAGGPNGVLLDGGEESGIINLKSFGAKGDGVTDDTAAIQSALDAAGNNSPWGTRGTLIFVPPGEYIISSTLMVYRMSMEMVGCGYGNSPAYEASPGRASVFRWNGPPQTPMMNIRDSYGVAIRRIRWEGKDGIAGTAAINLQWFAEDQQAGNAGTVIQQCHFGRYPHTPQGIHKGDLAYGVLMDGENGNNDEFKIDRCMFIGCEEAAVRIVNTQSVYGSINDCTIGECGTGIDTASHVTGYNLCFDACEPDFRVASTAHVRVFGWQSERSRKLADLSAEAALIADGGYLQLGDIADGVMIDAFPSDSSQVILRNMQFTQNSRWPRPKIRFGPSEQDQVVGLNFRIKVLDCTGLYPDQFELAGRLWAEVPESRGEVEFRGSADKAYHFRNFLRKSSVMAQTLDSSRIDLAVTDAAGVNLNSVGPLRIQGTGAEVHAGVGSPEGVIAAGTGSIFLRTDGSPSSSLYVKESDDGATGWIAK